MEIGRINIYEDVDVNGYKAKVDDIIERISEYMIGYYIVGAYVPRIRCTNNCCLILSPEKLTESQMTSHINAKSEFITYISVKPRLNIGLMSADEINDFNDKYELNSLYMNIMKEQKIIAITNIVDKKSNLSIKIGIHYINTDNNNHVMMLKIGMIGSMRIMVYCCPSDIGLGG